MEVLKTSRLCWKICGLSLPKNPSASDQLISIAMDLFILGFTFSLAWFALVILIWERDETSVTELLLVALHVFGGIAYFGPFLTIAIVHKENVHEMGETVEKIVNESN